MSDIVSVSPGEPRDVRLSVGVRRIENPGNFGSEGTMHRLSEDDKQLINLSKS